MGILFKLHLNFSTMINCLVVDDEPIARNGILEYIEQVDFLHAVAVCKNAIEASSALQNNQIDLVFLDIQMPKITGRFPEEFAQSAAGYIHNCFS